MPGVQSHCYSHCAQEAYAPAVNTAMAKALRKGKELPDKGQSIFSAGTTSLQQADNTRDSYQKCQLQSF